MKHRIAYRLILSASLLLLLSGCASTIVGMIKKQPAFNWTYIPHELKVGDASTYQSFDGSQSWRFEVTDVQDDAYHIKMYWLTADDSVRFLKDLTYYFVVGKDGYVRSSQIEDKSGVRTSQRIAGPGEYGYIDNIQPVKLERPEWVDTPLGRYEVNEIIVYSAVDRSPVGGTMKLTTVNFVSNSVPFGYVMQRNSAAIDLPLTEVLDFASKMTPINGTYHSLIEYFLARAEKRSVSDGNLIIKDR